MKIQMRPFIFMAMLVILGLTAIPFAGLCQATTNLVKFIKYGTSFGMCSGYCFQETIYDSKLTISLSEYYRGKGQNNDKPNKVDTVKTDRTKWNSLVKSVDLIKFYKLPQVIGCPDCADGGAEWIEIGTKNKTYESNLSTGQTLSQ